jgi:hypothetical protein
VANSEHYGLFTDSAMGAGGKEASLETFENHLKKLLHILDKLPKLEREKAVLILRNSAAHYSNLTSGQPLPAPAPYQPQNQVEKSDMGIDCWVGFFWG